ncbi:MAG: leucine-rich repeat domain-containing protein [Cytophagales bacterium]|nr:leucine-rich repeat domain-containing protein [Cytophaga sp.]
MKTNPFLFSLIACCMIIFTNTAHAQHPDSVYHHHHHIDYDSVYRSYKTYFSLEEALKDPLSVQKLDLSLQSLTTIPAEIGQLENLIYLDLSFIKFALFPPEFAKLKKLEYLNLSGTRSLSKVPAILSSLPALKVVDLRDHPEWPATKFTEAHKLLPKVTILK